MAGQRKRKADETLAVESSLACKKIKALPQRPGKASVGLGLLEEAISVRVLPASRPLRWTPQADSVAALQGCCVQLYQRAPHLSHHEATADTRAVFTALPAKGAIVGRSTLFGNADLDSPLFKIPRSLTRVYRSSPMSNVVAFGDVELCPSPDFAPTRSTLQDLEDCEMSPLSISSSQLSSDDGSESAPPRHYKLTSQSSTFPVDFRSFPSWQNNSP